MWIVFSNYFIGNTLDVIGPNAYGKTSLMKTILAMVIPDSGQNLVNNQSIENEGGYRVQIGYMIQMGRYANKMKLAQVLEMIQELRKKILRN